MSCINGIEHVIFSDSNSGILPHAHSNTHQVFFIMRGEVNVRIENRHYFITRPTAVFVSNFETHSFCAVSKEFSRFCISLAPSKIKQDIKNDKLLSIISNRPEHFCHCIDVTEIEPFLTPVLNEILKEVTQNPKEYPENASALLRSVFVALYRHSPQSFPFDNSSITSTVQKIKQKIESELATEQSLDDLAAEFHVSRYYLAHAYKQVTGYSIKNYRMLCRIAEARELLTNTSLSVSQISEHIGFPDASNFSKYFKKKTGYTPSQYRNIHKGEEI